MTGSRYYNRSQMVARWATLLATMFWGLLVMVLDNSMPPEQYPFLNDFAHENLWGLAAIIISATQIARTVRADPPCVGGHLCNFAMCVLWTWIVIKLCAAGAPYTVAALPPAAVLCTLAWVNFGAVPRCEMTAERQKWINFFRG